MAWFRPGPRYRGLSPCLGAVGPSHEGRDPQPSNRGLSVRGRRDGLRRRDPGRGGNRTRRGEPRRTRRLQRLFPAHPGFRAAVGSGRTRHPVSCRDRARHHARGPDRGGSFQQRVRAARALRLLPHLRAGAGRRGEQVARLPQADHDRGGDGPDPDPARREGGPASRGPDRGAGRAGHADRARRRSRLLRRLVRHRRERPPRATGAQPRRRRQLRARRRSPSPGARFRRSRHLEGRWRSSSPGTRLQVRAAGQRGDAAPRPGGDRLVHPARRPQPDPVHPRRGSGRARQRRPRARPRGRVSGPASSSARSPPRIRA